MTAPPWGVMQGGTAVNVSGPCLRDTDNIKVAFESWVVDCKRLNVSFTADNAMKLLNLEDSGSMCNANVSQNVCSCEVGNSNIRI